MPRGVMWGDTAPPHHVTRRTATTQHNRLTNVQCLGRFSGATFSHIAREPKRNNMKYSARSLHRIVRSRGMIFGTVSPALPATTKNTNDEVRTCCQCAATGHFLLRGCLPCLRNQRIHKMHNDTVPLRVLADIGRGEVLPHCHRTTRRITTHRERVSDSHCRVAVL